MTFVKGGCRHEWVNTFSSGDLLDMGHIYISNTFVKYNRIKHRFRKYCKRVIRRRLLDLLVTGSFPDKFCRVRREVIENKVDFFFLFLTYGNLSK